MLDLFADAEPWQEPLAPGAVILRRFALSRAAALLAGIDEVTAVSPFRHMVTPGGYTMSVAMANCGELGWATNERGYLYAPNDPATGQPWPPMPAVFQALCHEAAVAHYPDFRPDACLINRYAVGAKLSLHQDKDEPDLRAPIVSVSLGCLPSSSLGDYAATIRSNASCWNMAMWWCGAGNRGIITAFSR
jgi:alkylated DNA repair protein (DNA oxidative demethylase)